MNLRQTEPHARLFRLMLLISAIITISFCCRPAVNVSADTLPSRRIILIGDSRTEGMYQFIGKKTGVLWRYKSGAGIDWMKNTAVPKIESLVRRNTAVVILMGVNDVLDLWQADNYATYLNTKAAEWKAKGAETYYVSLTPVDDEKDKYEKNSDITAWNSRIKKKLSSNVTYVNIYKKMLTGLVTTSDGLHYQKESSVKYFNLVYDAVKNSAYDASSDQTNPAYYKLVYNFSDYMKYNSDLRAKYGQDEDGAFSHFLETGMNEGRQASSSFDPLSYRLEYKYLRKKYGNDWKQYYLHYIRSGYGLKYHGTGCTVMKHYDTVYNGTSYARVYNYNFYVTKHPEVFREYGYDEKAVLKHFVTVGIPHGYQASANFKYVAYKKYNPDLAAQFGSSKKDYYLHFIKEGYKQNRRSV